MKRYVLGIIAAAAGFSLLPSAAQAVCVQTGSIPRIFVQTAAATNIGLRANGAGAILFNFTTTNPVIINAAVAAETSHLTVQIVGNAAVCGAVIGGFSNGGAVINMLLSP